MPDPIAKRLAALPKLSKTDEEKTTSGILLNLVGGDNLRSVPIPAAQVKIAKAHQITSSQANKVRRIYRLAMRRWVGRGPNIVHVIDAEILHLNRHRDAVVKSDFRELGQSSRLFNSLLSLGIRPCHGSIGEYEPTDCRSVRLRSRFLLNSFWRQLLTHYKARTEALCESIEKSPIDVNGSKARGTFVAQLVGAGWRFRGSHSKGEPCACERAAFVDGALRFFAS